MKNLCPDCGHVHGAKEKCPEVFFKPAPVTSFYLCPECGTDWADTWECACNSECPSCGIKDIEPLTPDITSAGIVRDRTPEECCNMEMQEAFETVLMLARSRVDSDTGHGDLDMYRTALGLVTAYFLLKVKS